MDIQSAADAMQRYRKKPFCRVVDPADEMWTTGPDWYWSVGQSGLDCVLRGLLASQVEGPPHSILDLACGYGRVGRHLVTAFPAQKFFWCDVQGPEFCVKHFGGEAVHSEHELLNVELPKVDAVWVGSLFTHVPERRARAWLAHVADCLNPGGVMIATFHGRTSIQLYRTALQEMIPIIDRVEPDCLVTGWGYHSYDAAIDPEWGFSMTAIDRLARIAAAVPGVRIRGLTEGGWAGNHDVLVLLKS